MTIDELLKFLRFKVISDYPDSVWKLGQIIELKKYVEGDKECYKYVNESGMEYSEEYFRKYSLIFRAMGWWENRKLEYLPLYVRGFRSFHDFHDYGRLVHKSKVFKVDKYTDGDDYRCIPGIYVWIAGQSIPMQKYNSEGIDFIPASEEEYNAT
jgi:hypothetical protein